MKHGFIKVACVSPEVTVANPKQNSAEIIKYMHEANQKQVNLCVFPELCLTGYTCGDLFYSDVLLDAAKSALFHLKKASRGLYPIFIVGLPLRVNQKLFNCAAVLQDGHILGIVPKTHLPNYGEFYEKRQFSSPLDCNTEITLEDFEMDGESVTFGPGLVFRHTEMDAYRFAVEICEDLWSADPPSRKLCAMGATIILNPSASSETAGTQEYRHMLVGATSARLICGYVYANAGSSESTQDAVFSGHNIICENGTYLAESVPLGAPEMLISEIDVTRLAYERCRNSIWQPIEHALNIDFCQNIQETALTRAFSPTPFIPDSADKLAHRAESILQIQAMGLKKRIEITRAQSIVVGISGGLDSCLALLVMARAMDLLKRDRRDIIAVSMPCFGTTHRTRSNAQILCEQLDVTFREIDISETVRSHFSDIDHDESVRNVTYENSQARERTQVLMDIANEANGFVVGTGDLSELALGWATYNGDHMSMYGVNASIPKTLVRHIVRHAAEVSTPELRDVLLDILDTPVSPELLPAREDGDINQRTEDIVGPYELHDFFLYYTVRLGFSPEKIFRIALNAFDGQYNASVLRKWLSTFLRRFFSQQYKRSCLPDGPKVGSVALSPRGDWRMPTDASSEVWLNNF